MTDWNIYSPLWAPVTLDGKWLRLQDKDPFDYAKVERKIPASKELKISFDLQAGQNDKGKVTIEYKSPAELNQILELLEKNKKLKCAPIYGAFL